MHGVKRARKPRDPEEVARAKKEKEAKEVAEYESLLDEINIKKDLEEYSIESLKLTTSILARNPDFQTGWNFRRIVLEKGLLKDADLSTMQQLLESDLDLTTNSLRQNPKIYAVWEHRRWILGKIPFPDWRAELKQIEVLLNADGRNFHGWDYRRFIVTCVLGLPPEAFKDDGSLPMAAKPAPKITTTSELEFTTNKILKSVSNFSAWHYRTKMLTRFFDEQGWAPGSKERTHALDKEFEFVHQAIFTDPNDQSAWLYHRWLVSQQSTVPVFRRELDIVRELLEVEPDSRWCLDSIVYYQRHLRQLLISDSDATQSDTSAEISRIDKECKDICERLASVDPDRAGRYRDMSLKFNA